MGNIRTRGFSTIAEKNSIQNKLKRRRFLYYNSQHKIRQNLMLPTNSNVIGREFKSQPIPELVIAL